MCTAVRSLLVASAVAGIVLAPSSFAAARANTLVVPDPRGDVVAAGAGYDITSTTLTTVGTTQTSTVRGRQVTTYKPQNLVVRLTLAEPPSTTAGSAYEVDLEVDGCGYAVFSYTPGAAVGDGTIFTECGSPPDELGSTATLYDAPPAVKGSTITWTLSVKTPGFQPGTRVREILGFTTVNEPVFGFLGPTLLSPELAFDVVETAKTYVIG